MTAAEKCPTPERICPMEAPMQRMEEGLSRLERVATIIEVRLPQIADEVGKLDIQVNGNGAPGIKTDLHDVKRDMRRILWALGIVGTVWLGKFAVGIMGLLEIANKVKP